MLQKVTAPEEQNVYSLILIKAVRSSGAQCGMGVRLHSAPNGAR